MNPLRHQRRADATDLDSRVRVERIEIQTLHGQRVMVQILSPAACAGSSSWGAAVPKRTPAEVVMPALLLKGAVLDGPAREAAARSRAKRRARVAA